MLVFQTGSDLSYLGITRMNSTKSSRRDFLRMASLATATAALTRSGVSAENTADKPNVLFLPVDDLRPQLGCFGHKQMISPNIDRLASESVVFENCYCQVPVCGASRASLLTGVRPTRDRFIGYNTRVDEDLPGALTLPQHFRKNGYHTISTGKVFHHRMDRRESWSEEPWRPSALPGEDWRNYLDPESKKIAAQNKGAGPAYESPDVADGAYYDGRFADRTIADLRRLKEAGSPFFLACGFLKPHLPFNAPRRFWDMYKRDEIDLADNPFRPKGAPDAALHNWGELRAYAGIPQKGPLPDDLARSLVHGYYACVSYTDSLIGRLLDELDRLGLRKNTIVCLWGDHGWNLGEHGLWCKHCNFETSLHSPLLISAPGRKGGTRVKALTEYVDIFPSLCDLAGLPIPEHLEGASLVPLIKNPAAPWKDAVFSRYFDGDSVKTEGYRYTEWRRKDGQRYARMLYDHKADPHENINIAEAPQHAATVARLSKLLQAGWKSVALR